MGYGVAVRHEHVTGITRYRSQGFHERKRRRGLRAMDDRASQLGTMHACVSINQHRKNRNVVSWNGCTCPTKPIVESYISSRYSANVTETAIYLPILSPSSSLPLHKRSRVIMSHRSSIYERKEHFV